MRKFKHLREDDEDGAVLPPASERWRNMWKLALYLVALLLVIAALNVLSSQAFGDPTCPSTRWGMLMVYMACECVHTYNCAITARIHTTALKLRHARMPAFTFTFAIAHPSHLT